MSGTTSSAVFPEVIDPDSGASRCQVIENQNRSDSDSELPLAVSALTGWSSCLVNSNLMLLKLKRSLNTPVEVTGLCNGNLFLTEHKKNSILKFQSN